MKLLDVGVVAGLNASLDQVPCTGCAVSCRFDAFSCKKVQADKRLARHVQSRAKNSPLCAPIDARFPPTDIVASETEAPQSPNSKRLGAEDADDAANFIAAINMAFPDHDFRDTYPWSFKREDADEVVRLVSQRLDEPIKQLSSSGTPLTISGIWNELQTILVSLPDCEFYSFNPESTDSPLDDVLWSHFFFICNKSPEVHKIVFVYLHAEASEEIVSPGPSPRAAVRDSVAFRQSSRSAHSPQSQLQCQNEVQPIDVQPIDADGDLVDSSPLPPAPDTTESTEAPELSLDEGKAERKRKAAVAGVTEVKAKHRRVDP
eukprot:TRINITY_DN8158_c0_g2_i2.p1 TRINITY_DN8158_c0_g2~~TRINITY_DN8158_c0_g2_i2.p1  ORF type:complete len:318 (+),score=31.98 TRINITY_DN8158_c0_g2_i2:199-1152(+)